MPIYCVIGTNRGLGLEFVRQLAVSTDNTIIASTRPDADRTDLEKVAASSPAKIVVLDCDTSSVPSIHIFAQKIRRNVLSDEQKIDFLLNSAGINGTPDDQTSLSLNPGLLAEQVSINVIGPAKIVEFMIDNKVLAPAVRILNMSSSLGSVSDSSAMVPRKSVSYSISKAAFNMLTAHQAHDVRERPLTSKAVVIAMDPGWVKTRMGGDAAPLEKEESIGGMLKVLHALKDDDNGAFYEYTGERKQW
ncbi:c-signal protein [Ophiostoma piceae UAMH 11346]|uniref:C-signal protein n=1 Tax=Ophiostoma piceae (strain UAMH 11346) TaxID=1262450 RepID=S3BTV9_OPHP1|nr:c-signal protein [Ophiostoma piceae UAMH 11346]